MWKLRFRGQYASFFFAPLFIMIFIYGHIFIIIRRHQLSRQTLTQHTASSSSRQNTLNSNSGSINSTARYHPCSERCRRSTSSNGSTNYTSQQQGSINRRTYPSIQRGGIARNLHRGNNTDSSNGTSPNGVKKNIKVTPIRFDYTHPRGSKNVWFIRFSCQSCL